MLLSLKFNPQIQKYLYKIVIICVQAVLISSGAIIYYSRCQANFKR